MEEALLARLRESAALAAIVGDRIDWLARPRLDDDAPHLPTLPAVTLTPVAPGREYTHDGHDGLDRQRLQLDCWTLEKLASFTLKRAVLAEMEQARDAAGWRFHPAKLEAATFSIEDEDDGAVFRWMLDMSFYHEEIST